MVRYAPPATRKAARRTPTRPILLSEPSFDEAEATLVTRALQGRVAGDGPFGRAVERRLEELLGAPRVLLTTSCTHAMELALLSLDLRRGGEVVCPSFTFVSTANAVLRAGLVPVLADVEETWLGLDPASVEERLSPRTAALMPVHYGGLAAEMGPLLELAGRRGLALVEDAAQALFATWRGRMLGTLGDAGCFSFHETKNLTCGEGGALVLRDPQAARRAEIVREKGTNRSAFLRGEVDKYTWVAEGSSYVLSDLLAAVLQAQLDKHQAIQARRAELAQRYRAGLADWAGGHGVRLPAESPERGGNHHLFFLVFPDEDARDRSQRHLRAQGIMAAFHYVPLHSSPFGRTLPGARGAFPGSERVARCLLRLPLHARLSDEDVERVLEGVRGSLD